MKKKLKGDPHPPASQHKESKRKNKDDSMYLNVRPNATLREIYAAAREQFTAADLAKYADLDEPTIPAEQVLAEMEEIHAKEMRRRKQVFGEIAEI
jgi:hypothetical protein